MRDFLVRRLLGAAGALLLAVIDTLVQRRTMDTVAEYAKAWVATFQGNSTLSNEAKRQRAADNIRADLRSLGYTVADSVINLAIELAVTELKSRGQKKVRP